MFAQRDVGRKPADMGRSTPYEEEKGTRARVEMSFNRFRVCGGQEKLKRYVCETQKITQCVEIDPFSIYYSSAFSGVRFSLLPAENVCSQIIACVY